MLRAWNCRVMETLAHMHDVPNASALTAFLKLPGMLQQCASHMVMDIVQRDSMNLVNAIDHHVHHHDIAS